MLDLFAQGDPAQVACDGLSTTRANCGGGEAQLDTIVEGVVNILLYVVGVAAVVMLIVGGLRYITSNGDAQAASSARNTVLYSIIGLIAAIIAYAVINWIIGGDTGAAGTPDGIGAN